MSPVSMLQSLEYFKSIERFFSHIKLLVIKSKPVGQLPKTIQWTTLFSLYMGKILN